MKSILTSQGPFYPLVMIQGQIEVGDTNLNLVVGKSRPHTTLVAVHPYSKRFHIESANACAKSLDNQMRIINHQNHGLRTSACLNIRLS